MKYSVVVGNLNMGFQFFGIFDSTDDAETWADSYAAALVGVTDDYTVIPISPI